ncbi:MAG: excisionase family DNA binding protein [Limisphaerales bacterium]
MEAFVSSRTPALSCRETKLAFISFIEGMKTTNIESINSISADDRELLTKLQEVINGQERPVLLGREGAHIQFPEAVFHVLTETVRMMASGQSVVLLSENEEFTTQAAANHLGMSRPYLVKLLEAGEIPFHFVGTHRRVYLKDLKEYAQSRDAQRRESLDKLNEKVINAGLYDSVYTGEE